MTFFFGKNRLLSYYLLDSNFKTFNATLLFLWLHSISFTILHICTLFFPIFKISIHVCLISLSLQLCEAGNLNAFFYDFFEGGFTFYCQVHALSLILWPLSLTFQHRYHSITLPIFHISFTYIHTAKLSATFSTFLRTRYIFFVLW